MNESLTKRGFQTRCLLDTFLFLAVAVTFNLLWFSYNPAFRGLAWHPFLLIVLLIGLFYGLREALAAVLLSNLAYSWLLARAGFPFAALFLPPDSYHLISFLVAGLLFGEVGELYRRYSMRLNHELEKTRDELERAARDMAELELVNSELRQNIQFGEAHLAELHRLVPPLLSKDKPQIFESALELVEKITGAQASALYLYDQASGTYWRHSSRGQEGLSPTRVSVDTAPFPELKLKGGVISVKDLAKSGTPSVIHFVLAAPIKANGSARGAVFIEALPLSRITAQTEQNFQYLMDLINTLLESAETRPKVMPKDSAVKSHILTQLIQDQSEISKRLSSKLGVLNFKIENFDSISKELSPLVLESVVGRVMHIAEKNKRRSDTLTYQGNGMFTLLMHHPSSINVHPYIDRTSEEVKTVTLPTSVEEPVRLSFEDLGEASRNN